MNETEYTGGAGMFRNSDFFDAKEDLAGKFRSNPVEVVIDAGVIVSGTHDQNGRPENNVFSMRIRVGDKIHPRRLRMNATKRKILIAASGTSRVKDWAGLELRMYQTVDSDRNTGGKTAVEAVAIDAKRRSSGEWLRYYDYQQPRGRNHVEASAPEENWK